jgi:hypothetical protein
MTLATAFTDLVGAHAAAQVQYLLGVDPGRIRQRYETGTRRRYRRQPAPTS